MEKKINFKELLQLFTKTRTEFAYQYIFAFPKWMVEAHKEQFDFRDGEVYFQGVKVFIYPNEFKG